MIGLKKDLIINYQGQIRTKQNAVNLYRGQAMKDNTQERHEFAKVMWGLAEEFGGKISDDSLDMRFTVLKDYPLDQISKAGSWLLRYRTEKFPAVPTTKEIIEAIEKLNGVLESKTVASIECDKVFKKLKEFGKQAEPLFYNKTSVYLMTHRWTFEQLGNMDEKELGWFRKNFIESFLEIDKPEVVLIESNGKLMIPASNLKGLIENKKAI